ncbi:hypothetical protein AB1E18_013797 [Capra hircus]
MLRLLYQYVHQFGQKLVQRRLLDPVEEPESPTTYLNILDLVILGLGRSLGAGIYIVAGAVAKYIAGPAVIISLLVAALSCVMCGLCYAELWARVARSGSVYRYSYVTMGQLYAFITGWNRILSLFVATACVAKVWSYSFDSLIGNHISQTLEGTFSPHMPSFLATFPDFVALALVLVMIGGLVPGACMPSLVIKVFTGMNVFVPIFMIISGFIKGDLHNWQLTEEDYGNASESSDIYRTGGLGPLGSGGFVPFGLDGILQGAALCFYAYFGFEAILTKGNMRSIPLSIVISVFICFLMYFGFLAALTLMVPYYQIYHYSPFPQAFLHVGWDPARYVMAVVFLCALLYSLLGAMFVMSQLVREMADDRLLFRHLAQIHARTGTPVMAIAASGLLAGNPLDSEPEAGTSNILKSLWFPPSTISTRKSGQIVYGCAFLLVLLIIILSLVLAQWPSQVFSGDPVLTTVAVLLLLLITGVTVIIWRQPQDPSPLMFRVPAMPVLPLVSIFMNVYLMTKINTWTWTQFGIANAIGFVIYFGYGIRYSSSRWRRGFSDDSVHLMLRQYVHQFGQKLVCRWLLEPIEESESPTAHLNILDLVVLGVGRSLGAGVYVLIGFIAKLIAGPSVVICFLVDSLSSVLFGLCYAELGARIPRFDSVYLHSYVIMGQLCAFVIGWNLILSLFVGTACVAKTWSIAFDSLTGNHISQALEGTFSSYMPSALATFPDFVALGPLLLITGVLVLGVPVSAWIIKVFTSLNILIPIFMIISGFIKGDLHNWQLMEQDYRNTSGPSDVSRTGGLGPLGSGGFVPFGFEGILHGAAVFFRSYFGFDVIVAKGREARDPQRSVPLSVVISIFICFLAYSGLSAALTLMVPYYQIHPYNPWPQAFLFGAMFVLSWLICAMADDGLLFRGLGWIHAGTHSPIMAILASGTLAAIMALPFELCDIMEFMLIGIMLAYTLVALSVLVQTPLHFDCGYQEDQNFSKNKKTEEETEMGPVIEESPSGSIPEAGMSNFLKSLWLPASTIPTRKSGQIVYGCASLLVLLLTILSLVLAQWPSQLFSGDPVLTTVAVLLLLLITGVTVIIWRQPQDPTALYFKVPALPVLPLVSIFIVASSTMSRMVHQYVRQFGQRLVHRQGQDTIKESDGLKIHLSATELVFLGVGRNLGAGLYIVLGAVAKYVAGPAIVVCFLVAGLSSLLSKLCYVEFDARVLRSSSAYVCRYFMMGQLWPFVVGWNIILLFLIATACTAHAWRCAFDSLTGDRVSQALEGTFPLHVPYLLAMYADFFALGLVLLLAVSLGLQSVHSHQLLVLSFIIISGFIMGDLHNWKLTEQDYPLAAAVFSNRLGVLVPPGAGGFVPFDFEGVLRGAATCFYVFVGFAAITTTGRRDLKPQRSISLISLLVCFLAYFAVSAALTLMVPYYQIHHHSPLPEAFLHVGWGPARYVVAVGVLCALKSSLLGDMFPMSRLIGAMAEDGLLFRGLARVYGHTKIPVVAIMSSGSLAGIMALLFEFSHIANLMAVASLLAYSMVSFSVLVLRYQPDQNLSKNEKTEEETEMERVLEGSPLDSVPEAGTSNILKSLWFPTSTTPTQKSAQIVYGCAFLLVFLLTILSLVLAQWPRGVFSGDPVLTTVAVLLLLLITGVTAIIWRQPQSPSPLTFRMSTWTRTLFGIWNAIGFAIHFGYGIRHSLEENNEP